MDVGSRPGREAGSATVPVAVRCGSAGAAERWAASIPGAQRLGGEGGRDLIVHADDAAAAVALVLAVRRAGAGAVGAGVAIEQAEGALRRARRRPGGIAVSRVPGSTGTEEDRGLLEAGLGVLLTLESRRSAPQQAAGVLIESGRSQREAAADLGVSQQAVQQRLRAGLWEETRTLLDALLPVARRVLEA
ncbi:hypothetical protein [Micrococcus porci]|uniref:hypothetical protein n=1 Tax=Micrococcus porci TaxID=2856555 RepID=UPI003CF3975B